MGTWGGHTYTAQGQNREALGCWTKLTGDKLDHTDVRHTLLGDRQARPGAAPLGTHEEVFRALHASILQTALENWADRSQKQGGRRRDTKASLQRADTILKKLITRRWKQLRRQGKEAEFADTWILTGAARWHRGEPDPTLLALRHIPPPTASSTVVASGDGAGPVQGEKRKAAGWGGIVVAPAHPQRGAAQAYLLAGPVATDQGHPLSIPWRGESDKQCRRDLGDDEDARGSQRDRSTRGAHRSTVRFHVRHPSSPRCAAWKHASRQATREEGQQQRRDQKALATSVRGGATEGRARKTDDQESERTLGPRF